MIRLFIALLQVIYILAILTGIVVSFVWFIKFAMAGLMLESVLSLIAFALFAGTQSIAKSKGK